MVTQLYIVRHCEAEGNINETFQGHIDSNITEKGALQLERLAERFRETHIDGIYSSPLKRACLTAEAVNKFHGVPILTDRDLMEINGGKMENCKWSELPRLFPESFNIWKNNFPEFQAPGGESVREVYDRMKKAALKHVSENVGKTVVIASHGGAIRTLLCFLLGFPPEGIDEVPWVENTSVSLFSFDEELKPGCVYINDFAHIASDPVAAPHQMWWRKEE